MGSLAVELLARHCRRIGISLSLAVLPSLLFFISRARHGEYLLCEDSEEAGWCSVGIQVKVMTGN